MTSMLVGVPAIALSQAFTDRNAVPWDTARALAPDVIRRLVAAGWDSDACLNVNFRRARAGRTRPEGDEPGCRYAAGRRDRVGRDPRDFEYHWLKLSAHRATTIGFGNGRTCRRVCRRHAAEVRAHARSGTRATAVAALLITSFGKLAVAVVVRVAPARCAAAYAFGAAALQCFGASMRHRLSPHVRFIPRRASRSRPSHSRTRRASRPSARCRPASPRGARSRQSCCASVQSAVSGVSTPARPH